MWTRSYARCTNSSRWFLENGLLTPAESRSLSGRVEALCARIAPRAVALVNAFGIPAQCLAAPIALP